MAENDIGYYTLPVILSFDGIEKSVNSKLGKAFGDIGKKGAKQVADATVADLKKAEEAYEKLRNKAQDSLGKVRVEEERLAKARAAGKPDQIVAAEERLNKARRDADSVNRQARRSADDLADAQKRLGNSSGDTGGKMGRLGDLAGSAGSAMAAAGAVAAGVALAGITALGAGVLLAGNRLYELGRAWDDVADSLATRTATLGPQLDKLTNAVKNLAPATASSIGDIGNVVGQVSQALRLSGADLTSVSKSILDLNRITGETLNIRDLGKVFRGFGVDAADQIPTLDALYRASAATGLSVNELLSAVTAAGPAARTMGLDLSETASLLAVFNEAGIDGEKALGALALAAKNLAKDGRAPAEGLRETLTEVEGLLAAGRDADAINLATKIFGRGFSPILDAIRSGALDAQSLNTALADNGVTIDEVAKSTADWSERWQQLKNTLSVALEPLASGVFNTINAKLDQLADWVTNNQSKVIGFFQQLAEWAFRTAQSLVQFAADSLRAIGNMIKGFTDGLAELGGAIQWIPGLGKLGDALQDLDDNSGGIQDKFNKAADALERNLIPGLQKGADYTQAYLERTKQATRFTEVLGEAVATINDNGDIVLTDNTPEVTERLTDLGITVTEMPDGKFKVDASTDEATKILDSYRAQQEGEPIDIKVGADTTKAQRDIGNLLGGSFDIPIGVVPDGGPLIGGAGGARKFAGGRGGGTTGPEKGLTENSVTAKRAIESRFPQIQNIGGYRPPDVTPFGTFTEHSSGEAIDVMIPGWLTPAGKAYGDQIAQWALANADALGTEWVIWQQKTFYPDGRVVPMGDRKSPTQNHFDHVHLKTKPGKVPSSMRRFGPAGGGQAPASGGGGIAPLNTSDPMNVPEPTAASMSAAIDTSGLYAPTPLSATAGYDEMGNPGYYVPDARAVREAQQSIADREEAIKQADAAVAQARANQADLDYTASESARLSAAESVRSSEARAAKARRELADAQADYAETARGKFTQAAKSDTARGGQGGSQMSGLGGIFGSFLSETFGFGSWLPALDSFMPLQMADSLIGAFTPTADAAQSAGTSSAPFGIPDLAAPPMPTGGVHAGSGGAPGPTVVNVDQSQNFTNSPLGWDPMQVNKERNNNIMRAPRLPVGMGS